MVDGPPAVPLIIRKQAGQVGRESPRMSDTFTPRQVVVVKTTQWI